MIWCPVACCSATHICFWLPYQWGQGIEHSYVCMCCEYTRSNIEINLYKVSLCRRLQQNRERHRNGHPALIKWIIKPKYHYFNHQLLNTVRYRENPRHTHCFTDEDGMRWLKNISRKTIAHRFEQSVLSASRLRMKLTISKARVQNFTAAKRSERWAFTDT